MAYTAVAVLGHALVRCQEDDGSVNVEWRGAKCCVRSAKTDSTPCATSAVSSDVGADCGGCRDRAMAEDLATTKAHASPTARTQVPDAPAPLSALPVNSWAAFGFTWTACPYHVRAPIPPPPLAAIRTVVIRC
jgi:hypothetical protein